MPSNQVLAGILSLSICAVSLSGLADQAQAAGRSGEQRGGNQQGSQQNNQRSDGEKIVGAIIGEIIRDMRHDGRDGRNYPPRPDRGYPRPRPGHGGGHGGRPDFPPQNPQPYPMPQPPSYPPRPGSHQGRLSTVQIDLYSQYNAGGMIDLRAYGAQLAGVYGQRLLSMTINSRNLSNGSVYTDITPVLDGYPLATVVPNWSDYSQTVFVNHNNQFTRGSSLQLQLRGMVRVNFIVLNFGY